jgi:hypothetical protein
VTDSFVFCGIYSFFFVELAVCVRRDFHPLPPAPGRPNDMTKNCRLLFNRSTTGVFAMFFCWFATREVMHLVTLILSIKFRRFDLIHFSVVQKGAGNNCDKTNYI